MESANQSELKEIKKKQPKTCYRKIPETLIQSYDCILLRDEKKKRRRIRQSLISQNEQTLTMLKKLPIMSGKCVLEYPKSSKKIPTNYELTGFFLQIKDYHLITLSSIDKVKFIGKHGEGKKRKIKIFYEEQEMVVFLHIENNEELYFLFAAIIIRILLLKDILLVDLCRKTKAENSTEIPDYYQTELYKMSGYLGFMNKWEKRRTMFHENVLKIFREKKCIFTLKQVKQIWTRFEMHNGYFVIRVHHGIQKTDLGVPLADFTNPSSNKNWLFPIAKLVV